MISIGVLQAYNMARKNGHNIGESKQFENGKLTIASCNKWTCKASIMNYRGQVSGSALTHKCKIYHTTDENELVYKGEIK